MLQGTRGRAFHLVLAFSKNTRDISNVLLGRNKLSAETLTGSILFCPFYCLCIPVGRHLKTGKNSQYLRNFLFLMFSGAKTDRRLCTYGKRRKAGLFLGKKCFFHFLPSSTLVDINFKPGWHSTVKRVKDLFISSKKASNRCSCNFKATQRSQKDDGFPGSTGFAVSDAADYQITKPYCFFLAMTHISSCDSEDERPS